MKHRGSRIRRGVIVSLVIAVGALGRPVTAQSSEDGRAGPREQLARDFETTLALSAAPPAVAEEASVLLWTGSGFEVGRAGSNGVTCYVARSWPESLEPHCFDEEGSVTILPIHLRQMELWHLGRSQAAIEAEIGEGLRSGHFRLPNRPVMSYMMSDGQVLFNDEGTRVGRWQPHLMIYYPYLTQAALGLGAVPSAEAAMVVDPGTPLSNIMIVVRDFVAVEAIGPAGDHEHR